MDIHVQVNYSGNFVDFVAQVHTKTIKNNWFSAKYQTPIKMYRNENAEQLLGRYSSRRNYDINALQILTKI